MATTWTNVPITLFWRHRFESLNVNTTSPNTVIGAYVSDNLLNNGTPAGQDWFPGLTATITDPLAANNPNFAIELVNAPTGADNVSTAGTALNNSSGNWRFDNVSISGTPVPEPSSVVLAAFGLAAGGLCAWRRRRNLVDSSVRLAFEYKRKRTKQGANGFGRLPPVFGHAGKDRVSKFSRR